MAELRIPTEIEVSMAYYLAVGRKDSREEFDAWLAKVKEDAFDEGAEAAIDQGDPIPANPYRKVVCPFTQSHTREWCGNPGCRES